MEGQYELHSRRTRREGESPQRQRLISFIVSDKGLNARRVSDPAESIDPGSFDWRVTQVTPIIPRWPVRFLAVFGSPPFMNHEYKQAYQEISRRIVHLRDSL